MKKLIAMIGAVATAFGLFADAPTPLAISFEAEDAGVSQDGTTWTPASPWAWASEAVAEALALKPIGSEALPYGTGDLARRDDEFGGKATNEKYLPLETGKDTLQFDVAEGNIYLDQLVKFTGFEEKQTEFAAGTKIALWMSAIEQEGTPAEYDEDGNETKAASADYVAGETNLYVTCANVQEGAEVEKIALKLAGNYEPEKWYRVTIKSLGNIYQEGKGKTRGGFIVFIDGVQAGCEDVKAKALIYDDASLVPFAREMLAAGKLFPAIADTAIDMAKVGYAGIGAIDDVISDINGPDFAKTIDFSVTATGAAVLKVLKAGTEEEIEAYNGNYTIAAGQKVDIVFTANGPYVLKTDPLTLEDQEPANGLNDFSTEVDADPAVAQIDGDTPVYFASMEAAFAAVQPNETITVLEDDQSYAPTGDDEKAFGFTKAMKITVDENGIDWIVEVPDEEALTDSFGVAAGQLITVLGDLVLAAEAIPAESGLIVTGVTTLFNDIALNGKFTTGTLTNSAEDEEAGVIYTKMTLGADGAYQQTAQIAEDNLVNFFGNDDLTMIEETEVKEGESGEEETVGYKYTLKGATGFAIIIAGKVDKYYNTLQDAINDYKGDGEVTILQPCTLESEIAIANDVIVNFGGNVVTAAKNADDDAIWVKAGATVMLKNGMLVDNNQNVVIYNSGDLTIASDFEVVANNRSGIMAIAGKDSQTKAKLTVYGKVSALGTDGNDTWNAICGHGNDKVGADIIIGEGAQLISQGNGIYFPGAGTLTVNGGVIQGYEYGIYAKSGTVTVTGGEISSLAEAVVDPSVDVSGTKGAGHAMVVESGADAQGYADNLTFEVSGGKFTSVGAAIVNFVQDGATPIAAGITGGIFKAQPADELVAGVDPEGMVKWTNNGEGYMIPSVILAAAKIGDVKFETLDAAVAAAQTTDTIVVLNDLTLTATLDIAKPVAIDLNKKTVTFAANLATGIYAHDADAVVIENGKFVSADARTNIAGSKAIYFLRTSAEFTDVEIDAPGFDYVLTHMGNIADQGKNRSEYWTTEVPYTLDCDNVAVKGNGSLYHLEYVAADLDADCTAEQYTDKGYFSEAHQAAIYSSCGAVVTVNGGTYSAVNALQTGNLGGKIVVKDGEFNGNIKSWMLDEDTRDFAAVNKANIQIEGGKFTGNFVYADNCSAESELLKVEISGGDFSDTEIPEEFIEQKEGFTAKWVASELYADYVTPAWEAIPTTPVAEVNGVEYTDLHEAVDAVKNGETLTLLCNVDLEGVDWVPVTEFKGTFDGAGYIISNLTINAASADEVGLIGRSTDTIVQNVKFANANITGKQKVGVIVGVGKFSASNVAVVDSTVTGTYHVGGLFGNQQAAVSFDQITVTGCTITIPEDGSKKVGAIGGYFCGEKALALFSNCIVRNNTISGPENVGAILGQANNYSTFDNVVVNQPGMHFVGAFAGSDAYLTLIEGADTVITTADFCESGKYFWKPTLRGGTYSFEPTADIAIIEDGYKVIANGDDTWTVVAKAQVALTISAENATVTGIEAGTVYEGSNLTFTVAANTGYKLVDVKANGAVLEADAQGNYTYEVTGEETEKALAIVVTVEQDAQPLDPEQPTEPFDTDKEAEEAAAAMNEGGSVKPECIKVPEAAGTTDTEKAAYAAFFVAVAKADKTVEIELNEAGTNALKEATAAIETAVASQLSAITATAESGELDFGTVTKNVKPGFWYGVAVTTELGNMKTTNPAAWVQATKAGVSLKATKPAGNAAFFQTKAKASAK